MNLTENRENFLPNLPCPPLLKAALHSCFMFSRQQSARTFDFRSRFLCFQTANQKIRINSKILCLQSPSILVPRLRRLRDEKRAMGTRMVLTWLRLIHPSLPRLVKQRYGTELRPRTLASIKPEISQALNSLLEEIRTSDDARILRAAVADDFRRSHPGNKSDSKVRTRQPRQNKICPLCKPAGRSNTNHFLSQCTFLPDSDRRFMVKARQIVGILDNDQETDCDLDPDSLVTDAIFPFVNKRCHFRNTWKISQQIFLY